MIGCMLGFLYVTTILLWREIRYHGFYKNLDICTVLLNFAFGTRESLNLEFHYMVCWFTAVAIAAIGFATNQYIMYYQITRFKNNVKVIDSISRLEDIHYFSLKYTAYGSKAREYALFRSTYTHMLLVHVIPSIVSMYCVLNQPAMKTNWWD
jgi:hypothetical protein